MSRSTTAFGALGAVTAIAAAGIATSTSASADVFWQMPASCTVSYTSTDPSVTLPANATFQDTLVAAYDTHGDLSTAANGSTYVHSVNENTQITIPADVYAGLVQSGTVLHPSVSGSEYYTVNGKPSAAPFNVSVPASNQTHGIFVASASGDATDIPATAADKAADGLVKVVHTGTSITWKNGPVTANLMCGTGATTPTAPATGPVTTPTTPTGPTTKPTTPVTPTGPTTKPTTPVTPTGPTTKPVTPVTTPTGPTTKPVTPVTPAGPTTKPTMPSGPATTGPKIQTDFVSSKSDNNTVGAGFALAGVAALGGAVVLGRRRKA